MTEPAPQAKGRGRPPKERRNKLFTRETLLHAGMEVVSEKGFSAVGVDEILQRTGISRCSFYYYFKSKEGFGAELIDLYRDGILQELENCLADESLPPLNRLRAFVGQRRRAIMESGYRCGCLMGKLAQEVNTLPEPFRQRIVVTFDVWQQAFARGLRLAQEAGEVAPTRDCQEEAAVFWYGWEGAIQRANLERTARPLDLFTDRFFSRLTG